MGYVRCGGQGVGVMRGGLHEVDHMRWVTRGGSCEVGYARWIMQGGLCKVGYVRWGAGCGGHVRWIM